ncbi:MAG TPA: hypothetical protein VFM38_09980, partial [Candidatus Limnocylindrales bacterium]|nr:hypothetical protein [Candidatus Limnocylindrales bacterium]
TQVADPTRHVMRWRERARLSPAVEALRTALGTVLTGAPPTVRPALAATMEPAPLRQGLERAVDRAIAGLDRLEPPTSRWWWFLGLLQTLTAIAIAVSAAWVVIWILARPVVDTVDVPIIGSVPMPFAALLVSILVGYLLARLVGLHAGWVGRRWARRVRARVSEAIHDEVTQRGLAPLDALEDARARLSAATGEIVRGCAGG